eukprot:6190028-Pleurochrysis_carterae.AAC.8
MPESRTATQTVRGKQAHNERKTETTRGRALLFRARRKDFGIDDDTAKGVGTAVFGRQSNSGVWQERGLARVFVLAAAPPNSVTGARSLLNGAFHITRSLLAVASQQPRGSSQQELQRWLQQQMSSGGKPSQAASRSPSPPKKRSAQEAAQALKKRSQVRQPYRGSSRAGGYASTVPQGTRGRPSERQWDRDGDGRADGMYEDKDGDGVYELLHEDVDGDGVMDIVHEDTDGDGRRGGRLERLARARAEGDRVEVGEGGARCTVRTRWKSSDEGRSLASVECLVVRRA